MDAMDTCIKEFIEDEQLFKYLIRACSSGFTMARIAKELGFARSTLYNHVAGRQNMSMSKRVLIVEFLRTNHPEAFERAREYKRIYERIRERESFSNIVDSEDAD